MRIAICDDDRMITTQIEQLITEFFKQHSQPRPVITSYPSGDKLLCSHDEIDILFLDMEMPGTNGVFVGNELKKKNDKIIILVVTSYLEYLDEAMRFHVFRYLSKPIDKQRFLRNLTDAISQYHNISYRVSVEEKNHVYSVAVDSILCIEANNKHIIIHTLNRNYSSIHTMDYWEDSLPKNIFFRSHRSYLVNMKLVSDFDHALIHFYNSDVTAYLTRRNYSLFNKAYLLCLEGIR